MRPASAPLPFLVKPPDLSRAEDAVVARAAALGDAHAVEVVWDRYASLIRGLLRRSVGRDGVEDLLQDVFLKFFQSVPTLRDPSALRSFLIGISVRVAMSELRRRRVRRWVTLLGWDFTAESSAAPSTGSVIDPVAPARDDDAREAIARLYTLLGALDPETRLLFTLRYVEGLELTDIADALDVSLATVKRRLSKVSTRVHALAVRDERLAEYLTVHSHAGDRDDQA